MKKVFLLLMCIGIMVCFTGCFDNLFKKPDENSGEVILNNTDPDRYKDVTQNPVVTMQMEDGKVFKIELYPKIAPTTVENFIELVQNGFYDGLTFHRVIPSFVAQGGDPAGNGTGGPGYTIKGEFAKNDFSNDLSHDVGVVSMARSEDYDSAGSQFFIVTGHYAYLDLDGSYAAFGKVIEGMDVVSSIVNAEVIRTDYEEGLAEKAYAVAQKLQSGDTVTEEDRQVIEKYYAQMMEIDRPVTPPKIEKATVDTFGYQYASPVKIMEEAES